MFNASVERKLDGDVQNNPNTSAEKIKVTWNSFSTTGYLQKLSVVFYTNTASEADQLQKLLLCDPKLRSTGFDGANNARLDLSQTGNESCSQMKGGFDCFLMVE